MSLPYKENFRPPNRRSFLRSKVQYIRQGVRRHEQTLESQLRSDTRRRMLACFGRSNVCKTCLRWVVAAVFLATASHGQNVCAGCKSGTDIRTESANRARSARLVISDPKLKALVDDAEAVLPEFKADILLSVVESGKIADPRINRALVNRAYRAAEAVQPPYAEAPYGRVGSTPQGRRAIALSMTQLDRMSLQSRAVHDMQHLNRGRARAMFQAIQFPALGPLGCNDNWIYDPGPFYSALTEVADSDFSLTEVATGKRLAFLAPYSSHLESHAQVIPVAHFFKAAKLTTDELRQFSPAYAEALLTIPRDEHTFSVIAEDRRGYVSSVYGASLSAAMSDLIAVMGRAGVPSSSLLRPLRAYLVENFNAPRCDIEKQANEKKEPLPSAVSDFNRTFDMLLKQGGIAPISPNELAKTDVLPTRLWDDPADDSYESRQLTTEIQRLQDLHDRSEKNGQLPGSWWRELDDFLSHFYSWQQGDEPEANYARERADFYMNLIDMIPKSPQREKVMEDFVSFLEQHSYQNLGGAEWFINVKLFFMGMYAKDAHQQILNAFLNSRDPVLNLYARLEALNGKPIGPHWPAVR